MRKENSSRGKDGDHSGRKQNLQRALAGREQRRDILTLLGTRQGNANVGARLASVSDYPMTWQSAPPTLLITKSTASYFRVDSGIVHLHHLARTAEVRGSTGGALPTEAGGAPGSANGEVQDQIELLVVGPLVAGI
eukprot:CAMPEP_0195040346 /NCGR_PEP_ID=MMETSP0326_2-20130528/80280_1 /TAXON_ID=2866 ORGANISM="Crypthecodinium cohnii, Strain Seligo" /NCGR_SAMPLE_ID=MMETSP0326_2 /ASSEMBLY_ACC=CAM_ASM_000348 /LENGTH=135 /DNA_ID=CAMNT_0040067257 /DNA_START=552 /DNA_END=959 /DNA_ORIENTATION=+